MWAVATSKPARALTVGKSSPSQEAPAPVKTKQRFRFAKRLHLCNDTLQTRGPFVSLNTSSGVIMIQDKSTVLFSEAEIHEARPLQSSCTPSGFQERHRPLHHMPDLIWCSQSRDMCSAPCHGFREAGSRKQNQLVNLTAGVVGDCDTRPQVVAARSQHTRQLLTAELEYELTVVVGEVAHQCTLACWTAASVTESAYLDCSEHYTHKQL